MTISRRVIISLKVFFLVIWPLCTLLPILIVKRPAASGTSALIFFMLLPHLAYPFMWMIARFTRIDALAYFGNREFVLMGLLSGIILPVAILTPLLIKLSYATDAFNTLYACILILVGTWIPLLIASVWAPLIIKARAARSVLKEKDRHNSTINTNLLDFEIRNCFVGLFFALSTPLCLFLPLYLALGNGYVSGSQVNNTIQYNTIQYNTYIYIYMIYSITLCNPVNYNYIPPV